MHHPLLDFFYSLNHIHVHFVFYLITLKIIGRLSGSTALCPPRDGRSWVRVRAGTSTLKFDILLPHLALGIKWKNIYWFTRCRDNVSSVLREWYVFLWHFYLLNKHINKKPPFMRASTRETHNIHFQISRITNLFLN